MKLKKLLSLALAVVMALSMLTACDFEWWTVTGDSGTTYVAISTKIVEEVEKKVKAGRADLEIGKPQYDLLPFTGNESADLAVAQSILNYAANGRINLVDDANVTTISQLKQLSTNTDGVYMWDGSSSEGYVTQTLENSTTYVILLATESGDTVETIADALYNLVLANQNNEDNNSALIDTMTVGGVAVSTTDNTIYSYNLDSTGYTAGYNTYAVVVFSTAALGNVYAS